MCLVTTERTARIATKNIICFKIVKVEKGGYKSPFLKAPLKNGLNVAHGPKEVCFASFSLSYAPFYEVSSGYIHAYTKKKIGKNRIYCWDLDKSYTLLSCVIPKGARYYVSVVGNEVCANKMIINYKLSFWDRVKLMFKRSI